MGGLSSDLNRLRFGMGICFGLCRRDHFSLNGHQQTIIGNYPTRTTRRPRGKYIYFVRCGIDLKLSLTLSAVRPSPGGD